MKKILFLLVACLFVSGCGSNKVVCTGTYEENGQKYTAEIIGELKNDKIDKVSATMEFSDKKTAEQFCSLFELANSFTEDESKKVDYECKDKKVIFKDYTKLSEESDQKLKGMTKKEFKKAMQQGEGKVTCK